MAKPITAVSIISGESEGTVEVEILEPGMIKLEAHKDSRNGELISFVEFEVMGSNRFSNSSNSATSSTAGNQDSTPEIEVSKYEIFVGDDFSVELKNAKSIPFVYWTYNKAGVVMTVSGENQKMCKLKAIGAGEITLIAHKDARDGDVIETTIITVKEASADYGH